MDKIPFSPPRIDQAILDEVNDTLRSGWITTGPKTKKLEQEVAQFSQSRKVLCVNSATAGMELALRWWGLEPGDEVILPAYTYCSTANVVEHCGATPVLVDIHPDTGTLDMAQVAEAINTNTKAIMPVDLAGLPVDYTALHQLLQQPGILEQFQPANAHQEALERPLLLTDAAHSLGALYLGQPAARQTDFAVFSFHAVKNLTTAEGGAICMNPPDFFDVEEIYKRLNTLSLHGQNKDALAKFGKNSWEYDVVEPGFKCNMPDVLASIGLVELNRYGQDTLPKRERLFQNYLDLLQPYDWAELPTWQTETKRSSCHLFLLKIRDISLAQRNSIIERIFEAGVSVNVHYKPLPLLSYYREAGYKMEEYPVANDFWEREITLPLFYDLTEAQQQRVVEVVAKAVKDERR